MKKLMFYCVTLSLIAIGGALLIKSNCGKAMMNPIVMANTEALADPDDPDDPDDSEEFNDGEGGGSNKFDEVTCSTVTYVDPATGIVIEFQTKYCAGSGRRKCKC